MENFDFTKMKRSPDVIKTCLVKKEDRTIAKSSLSILIPKFYYNKGLAEKTPKGIELLTVFPIVNDKGVYAVVAESAKQTINYARLEEVTVGDDVYECYTYTAGDIITETSKIVKSDGVLFPLFDAFFMLGKLPSFLSYVDVAELFVRAKEYTGSRIGDIPMILEVMVSALSRSKEDPNICYKDILEKPSDLNKPVHYIGLMDTDYAVTNAGSRMISGYFDKNMNLLFLNKENKHVKDIEALRR